MFLLIAVDEQDTQVAQMYYLQKKNPACGGVLSVKEVALLDFFKVVCCWQHVSKASQLATLAAVSKVYN